MVILTKNKWWVVCLLLGSFGWSSAQKMDQDEVAFYSKEYPEDQAIFLKYYQEVDVKISGDSLLIKTSHLHETLHIGNQSNVYSKDGIFSSSFYKTKNISARTLIPDNRKFKVIEVTEFKESYDKNSSTFYDDSKYLNFIFPSVQPGAHTILEYEQEIIDPKFLTTFLFQNYLPIEHSKYSITVDNGVQLKLSVLNDPEGMVNRKTEDLGNRTKYTFEYKKASKLKVEKDAPSIRYSAPHLAVTIEKYMANGVTYPVLSSTEDLFKWYSTFIKGLKTYDYKNIKEIVASIIQPNDSEIEKVRKVFHWVQNNIKYIAFEDGMRGLIPHNASYVCEKRYGDCKDMATIVVNMLHAAGVDAYFTWIGTRDIPYKYSEFPSPMVDNHMIATYIDGEDYYFLDATSQYSSYKLPSSMIQGKEALIALSDDTYEIRTVPIIEKTKNIKRDSSFYSLKEGNVVGSGFLTLTGYPKVFNSYNMIKSNKKGLDDFMTGFLGRGSNKFFVEDYSIQKLDDLEEPIEVKYAFRIEDYYRKIGNKIYFNMNLEKSHANEIIEKERTQPLEGEFQYMHESISVLEIPANFKIKYLPENRKYTNDSFGFNLNYIEKDGSIILKSSIFVDYILLNKNKFEQWNEGIKELSNAYRDALILENDGS